MNKWYVENGEQGDIVISTRVRLARNLEDYPFPCRLTVKGKEKVCEEIKNAMDLLANILNKVLVE